MSSIHISFYRMTLTPSADYAMLRYLFVRLSHSGIVSIWFYISSNFFRCLIAPQF